MAPRTTRDPKPIERHPEACRYLTVGGRPGKAGWHPLQTSRQNTAKIAKATGQAFSFDGNSVAYGQQGTFEQYRGKWRIHTVKDLNMFACGSWDASKMEEYLKTIDEDMYKGWHALDMVDGIANTSGDAFGIAVEQFIDHVHKLMKDDTNLYLALAQP